jgi:hypothetical protein
MHIARGLECVLVGYHPNDIPLRPKRAEKDCQLQYCICPEDGDKTVVETIVRPNHKVPRQF